MKLLILSVSCVAVTLLPSACFAFKSKFYGYTNLKDYDSLLKKCSTANRRLRCIGLDEIDIGIGRTAEFKLENGAPSREDNAGLSSGSIVLDPDAKEHKKRFPIYFKREEIRSFLQREKHKDLLVAKLFRPVVEHGQCPENVLAEFNRFFDSLGFKRVIVLGVDISGTILFRDTDEEQSRNR